MASNRPQFDPVGINAKPRALKLTQFFVLAFLVFFIIDFFSIFTVSAIAGSHCMVQLNGGSVEFSFGEPVLGGSGGGIRFALWFPTWNPTYFYFSGSMSSPAHVVFSFPLWILSVACAAMALITFHRGVSRADLCANCRYDIRSQSTHTCPECGKPINPGIAQLPVSKTLRGFASFYKKSIAVSASLAGVGLALVLGMRVFVWMQETQTTIIVPSGYVGTIVFVEDERGVAPEGGWGKYLYRVPDSGVLRVSRIDVVKAYPGTPSAQIDFICREESGEVIQTRYSEDPAIKWFDIDGPYGKPGITIAKIRFGRERLPDALRLTPEDQQRLREQGVPANFVAPHEIRLSKPGAASNHPSR